MQDGGLTRLTYETSRIWLFFYERMSAKATRERWRPGRGLFDIGSWFTGGRWVREGQAPTFDLTFHDLDGDFIPYEQLNPGDNSGPGYQEYWIHFGWFGRRPTDLGTDVRTVYEMRMVHEFNGAAHTISETR